MKQIIKWFSSLALSASTVFAAELDWTFNFTPEDVSLTPAGAYTVVSLADGSNVRDAIGAPAIPAKFANILLPDGATDVSIDATGDLVLLASDIVPYPVQRVAPKSKPQPPFVEPDPAAYASASPWPAAVATFEGLHDMQGSTFVSVRVNPLVYVASEKALYYRPSVAVTVTYTAPASAPRSTRSVSQNALATEMVNALVVNPETADSPSAVRRRAAARAATVDYLIITSSTLSNAFQNLAAYRATAAGGSYKTLVVTTNTIASSYSGDDIQMKIRNCISNYVKTAGTTYVVLGGDDSVVPDRDCYAYVPDNSDPTYEWCMPTDLYYSDLTGTWKANNNTNFGVTAANVDMSPDVIVGRIPVTNATQLSGYLAKVQAFEADTSHTRNSIILGGPAAWCRYYGSKRPSDNVSLDGHAAFRSTSPAHTYVSDSEMWLRRLYRDGLYTNWNLTESASSRTVNIACDSITSWDSSKCGDKELNYSNLASWLNHGYTHLMFSGHGFPQGWGMETGYSYDSSDAASQTNLVAFVYTDACLTGAFDEDGINSSGITVDVNTSKPTKYTSEPCLGEAFIRNANGGALVHMGCARYGWGNPDYQDSDPDDEDSDGYYTNCTASASSDGGPSTVYAYKFYKRLYESAAVSSNRTLGAAFAMSKADLISQCSAYGTYRWIQFGLNYLGDPAIALYPRAVPDAAPEFSSATASTNGLTGEAIYFDFSELLTAGSPAPSYTVSTTVSSSLYEWADGILSFTPSATGSYAFTCTASNTSGTATCTLTVTVTPPPPETPAEVAVVSSDSFTATWSAVSGASTYELLVVEGAASGGGSGPFTLVTSSSGLTAGEYVILADGIDRAMNNSCSGDSSGVLSYEDVTVDNSTVTTDDASIIWTLAGNADSCTLYNAAAQKYVNPATARNVGWSSEASGSWTLSMSSDLVTVANAANTSWMLQYNSGSPRFALYDNNNQKKLHFYRRNAGRALPRAVGDVVYSNAVGNVTSFAVTGLQPETSYSYSVRAIVDGQPTPWSDSVSVTTTEGDAAPAISVEQTSYAVAVGDPDVDFTVTVSGSPSPALDVSCANAVEDQDFIFYRDSGGFLFTPSTVGTYLFVFTATNGISPDASVTVTITVSAAPVTVPALTVTNVTDTSALASWTACDGVSSYTLQLASDNQFTPASSGGSGGFTEDFTNFTSTVYSSTVATQTVASGEWTYVNVIFSPTASAVAPGSKGSAQIQKSTGYLCLPPVDNPTSLSMNVKGSSTGTMQLQQLVSGDWETIGSWDVSGSCAAFSHTFTNAGTAATLRLRSPDRALYVYDISVSAPSSGGDPGSLISSETVSGLSHTFTGLSPYTVYYARVKGNADWSNIAEFITDVAGDSAPVWSTLPTPSVTVGSAYSFTPAEYVSGTPAPTITLSSTTASSGYTFADGTLSFTPAATGSFDFTFTANNGIGSPASATLTVNSTGSVPVVSVPQTSYSTSLGGADVEFDVTATGTPTPTLALSDTTATSGVTFDPDDGSFSFTPYATGDFTFTFTATSLLGSDSVTVTVTVSAAAVTVPTLAVTNITATNALASWTACDGVSSYTLQLSTNEFSAGAATITDTLTAAKFGLAGNSYGAGSYASEDSGAGYAAWAMKNGDAIQLKSKDNVSGIVVTKSAGSVSEVRVSFASGTQSDRTLNIYGSSSAYSSAADLYSASTPLGTIVYDGSNATGSYTINGSYAFIGIRSASGAIYLDNVEIDWTPASGTTSKGLVKDGGDGIQTFTVNDTSYEFTGLTPETTYYARVKGTSDWSNVAEFTTDEEVVTDTAPSWKSTFPATDTVDVGEVYELANLSSYVSGSPAPAITFTAPDGVLAEINNGNFQFIPAASGDYTFTFTAANGISPDATATLVVTAVGQAPVLVASLGTSVAATVGETVGFTVTATGIPAPTVEMAATEYDAVFIDGEFAFTPAAIGTYAFTFTADNGEGTDSLTVTVTVSAAPVTVPELTVTNVTTTTALASWTACDGVSTYTLQLATNDFPAASSSARSLTPILSEDFSGFTPTSNTDIGSNNTLNNYTTNSGWTGVKVYPEDKQAKIGAGSAQGWLMTPALHVSGSLTVVWEARTYGSSDKYTLLLGISEDGNDFTDTTITLYDDMTGYTNTFEVTGTTAYVRWMGSGSSKARFYLDNVRITTPESGGGDDPAGDDVQEFTVAGTSHTFTNLTPDTAYLARVKGNAGWSEEVIFQTLGSSDTAPAIDPIADQTYTYGDNDGEFTLTVTASGTPSPTLSVTSDDAIGLFDIDAAGEFLFMPTAVGTFHFTVTAANGVSPDASEPFAVTVTGTAPTLAAIADQTVAVEEEDLTISLTVTGNPAPTVSVASSDAPEGMFEINSDGDFYFVFAEAGTFHFTVTATNGVSPDATQSFAVTVTAAPAPLTDYQQWLQAHGIATDTSATDTAPNGHTYGENYAADIDPSSPQWLEITVTTTNFTFAPSSTNRYYQLLYTTDLSTGIYQTNNLGQGATSGSFPEVEGDWYGGLRVTPEAP